MKRLIIAIVVVSILGGTIFALAPRKNEGNEPTLVGAEAIYPKRQSIERNKTFVSRIMPESQAVVLALIPDKVIRTTKNVGDTVKKGEVLFEIDPGAIEDQLELARSALRLEEKQLAQKTGSSERLNLLSKELQLKTAKMQYDMAFDEFSLWDSELTDKIEETKAQIKVLEKNPADNATKIASLRDNLRELEASYDAEKETKKLSLKNNAVSYNQAKRSYELETEVILEEEKALDEAGLAKARSAVDSALFYLDKARVTSPIDGVCEYKGVSEGEAPDMKSPAYIIADKSLMSVSFGIPDTFIKEIELGDSARIDYNGEILDAVITEISMTANEESGLYNIKAVTNAKENLLTGTTVTVSLATQKSENALTIPPECVYFDDDDVFVYTLEDGSAVRKDVCLGVITKENAEITQGISEDDLVIKTRDPRIATGVKIKNLNSLENKENGNMLEEKGE